jgi:hypothetical protein
MSESTAGVVIGTILRHDQKQTSYKIALLRAINDVVLNFPDLDARGKEVAIPVQMLADFWIAYFWAFAEPNHPIYQGARAELRGEIRNDMAFRPQLAELRKRWEAFNQTSHPADGFFLVNELRIKRKRERLPESLLKSYRATRRKVGSTIRMPIQYAGPGQWNVFPKPRRLRDLGDDVVPVPGTSGNLSCLSVSASLWKSFRDLSLYVEALCIHEWCLFTETVEQAGQQEADRGAIFRLLTARPDNRVSLTWERNQVDLLLMEGRSFECPWTGRVIDSHTEYDLDHLLPVAVYPVNEMWNLAPADRHFNQRTKRDRLPSAEALKRAEPRLAETYATYAALPTLAQALHADAELRFADLRPGAFFNASLASATVSLLDRVATARNLARFPT